MVLHWDEIDHQIVLDSEDGIVVEVLCLLVKDLCHQG